MTSIYLAGKIGQNDWRHDVVGRGALGYTWTDDISAGVPPGPWPVETRAVLDTFDYTGPYFIGCDHGCAHQPSSHGAGVAEPICGAYDGPKQSEMRNLCFDAINRSDIFFAWLDDLTAYGTLVETGYAFAQGKFVAIGTPKGEGPYAPQYPTPYSQARQLPQYMSDGTQAALAEAEGVIEAQYTETVQRDMWFALSCGLHIPASSPHEALAEVVRWYPQDGSR